MHVRMRSRLACCEEWTESGNFLTDVQRLLAVTLRGFFSFRTVYHIYFPQAIRNTLGAINLFEHGIVFPDICSSIVLTGKTHKLLSTVINADILRDDQF